jgi:hypothetical protein
VTRVYQIHAIECLAILLVGGLADTSAGENEIAFGEPLLNVEPGLFVKNGD